MYDEIVKRLRETPIDMRCAKVMRDAADAIEELSREVDMDNDAMTALYGALPRWIPVTEQLPEAEDMVLVATVHGGVYYGFLHHAGKFYTANNTRYDSWCWEPDVTHWMPLPEPPKGEE